MMRITPSRVALFALAAVALVLILPAAQAQYGAQNSVSGRVYDANHNAIPGAKVTLYYTKFLGTDYVAAEPVKMAGNPQYTSNGSTSLTGLYQFSGLVPDVYIVAVEKEGVAYSEKVLLREGTKTADLTLAGYIEKNYTATPKPTNKPSPTSTIIFPSGDGSGTDMIAIISSAAKLALMALIGLQFLAGVVALVLRAGR